MKEKISTNISSIYLCAVLILNFTFASIDAAYSHQNISDLQVQKVKEAAKARQVQVIEELSRLVAYHSVSVEPEDVRNMADHLKSRLESFGFQAEVVETKGMPFVFAERKVTGAKKTLLLYFHFRSFPLVF